jgi:4-diphosphocytidyl-2-C-methyl-D-erythritol kinase
MPTAVRSHAKINLGLYLGAPRADGFHSLVTVYQTLEMHDVVTVSATLSGGTKLRLSSNDARVPCGESNTAWKMISLALEGLQIKAEVDVHIEKRLPVQGGLGAGSGNAVAALIGLEKELDFLALDASKDLIFKVASPQKMAERAGQLGMQTPRPGVEDGRDLRALQMRAAELKWAEQVGSDVPLFLVGGTVLGFDRGQRVKLLPDLEPTWCLVVVPEVGVSTPQAFRDWDALCAQEGLTAEASTDRLRESSQAYAAAFSVDSEGLGRAGSSGVFSMGEDLAGPQEATKGSGLVRTGITSWIENDFERVVFPQHPSLAEIKRILAATGTPEAALYSALSGSGSALFGLYLTRGDLEAARDRIERESQTLAVRNTVITRTLPRRAYWEQMIVES